MALKRIAVLDHAPIFRKDGLFDSNGQAELFPYHDPKVCFHQTMIHPDFREDGI